MGFRIRRSIKIMPGVRLNFSLGKRGLTTGVSAGVKGARFSFNSQGARRTTVGVPGTGISHVTVHQAGASGGQRPGSGMMILAGLAGLLGIGWIASLFAPPPTQQPAPTPAPAVRLVTVSATSLRCRQTPSTTAGVVVGLKRGERVRIGGEQGDWLRIDLDETRTCWAASRYLDPS